ncbi:O-antigen polysaccharide polymerase Wzy family protein [Proteus terrae]|uniref:O-antigen polysaccharide polymerase Wzy family protein n=1 Tax=Proteus terrae TaxID=1574161 RepID=UPI001CBF89D4|nr:O-antigen polysaccharide polymerase Wzy family protein [Proteus terrae]
MLIEYASLLVYLLLWLLIVATVTLYFGGINKHLSFLFVLSLSILYDFLTPLYGLANGWVSLFGNDISDWFAEGIMLSTTSLLSMGVTYIFLCSNFVRKVYDFPKETTISVYNARAILVVGVSATVTWAAISGYGVGSLFFIRNISGGGSTGLTWDELNFDRYNYLKQCVEFLIPGLVIAVASDMKKKELLAWFFIVTLIFLSLGFRYRLILVFISIAILKFYQKGFDFKLVRKLIVYGLVFVTLNIIFGNVRTYIKAVSRGVEVDMALIEERQAKSFEESAADNFFKYSRNYLSNMSLLKYLDQGYAEHDYGESMFYQIIVRALPGIVFGGEKPFPKSLESSTLSWHSNEGLYAGEAFTYVMDFYFAFGILGVIIFSSLLTIIIFFFSRNVNSLYKAIFISITTASLFHYLTRGFLAGYLMSYIYMILPLIYLYLKHKPINSLR